MCSLHFPSNEALLESKVSTVVYVDWSSELSPFASLLMLVLRIKASHGVFQFKITERVLVLSCCSYAGRFQMSQRIIRRNLVVRQLQ
jgi:hypothetical protein